MKTELTFQRPKTAAEVAAFSDTELAFSYSLRDFQHELRNLSCRADFEKAFKDKPQYLQSQLDDGGRADAYLAAYVEFACNQFGLKPPAWVFEEKRIADRAWFALDTKFGRGRLLIKTPAEFMERNLFTVPDVPFGPKPGRPKKPRSEINRNNAARQKRYRQRKLVSSIIASNGHKTSLVA